MPWASRAAANCRVEAHSRSIQARQPVGALLQVELVGIEEN